MSRQTQVNQLVPNFRSSQSPRRYPTTGPATRSPSKVNPRPKRRQFEAQSSFGLATKPPREKNHKLGPEGGGLAPAVPARGGIYLFPGRKRKGLSLVFPGSLGQTRAHFGPGP